MRKKVGILVCLLVICAAAFSLVYCRMGRQTAESALATLCVDEDAARAALTDEDRQVFVNESALAMQAEKPKGPDDSEDVACYVSPEGIRFRSQSKTWDRRKLEGLYQELLLNKHGDELYTLAEVIVYPQEDDFAAAEITNHNVKSYRLNLAHPTMPKQSVFTFYRSSGIIKLYDGDNHDTVGSMASSLSHEYGHHFTFTYMLNTEYGCPYYRGTEYARLRGLDEDQVRAFGRGGADYRENHHWYYYEIAAEDYVVLMGSPNTRSVAEYRDIQEYLDGVDVSAHWGQNAQVQENLMIPMANEVPGLAEYFYSFLGEEAPEYHPKEIKLDITHDSESFSLDIGYRTFDSYTITWNKAYGEDAVYTLVCFDEEDYPDSLCAVKTVTAGEEASAVVGTAWYASDSYVSSATDNLDTGTKTFVVTVILPDGNMYCSEAMKYTF